MMKEGSWQTLYRAAILERDPVKRYEKIALAHVGIQRRVKELDRKSNHDVDPSEELQEIADALDDLQTKVRVSAEVSTQAQRTLQDN